MRGNAEEGAQARHGSCVVMQTKMRKRGQLVRRNAVEGTQTGQSRVVGLGTKVRRRGAARASECGRRCAGVARLVRGNTGEGAQTGQTGSWDWAQKCAGGGRLVGGYAGEGTQTGQSRIVGLGTKVRRRGAACGSECGRRCADGARSGQVFGRESGFGCARMLIGIHRSLSEPIEIYRRGSALFGFVLIDFDKF